MRAVSRTILGALAALIPAAGGAEEARVIVRPYPASLAPTPVDPAPEAVTPVVTPVVALPDDGRPAAPSSGPKRYRAEPMTGTSVAAPASLLVPKPAPVETATAVPVVARPTPSNVYRVVKGGRLADVATKTGVPLDDIVRLNPSISPADRLSAGMIVALP